MRLSNEMRTCFSTGFIRAHIYISLSPVQPVQVETGILANQIGYFEQIFIWKAIAHLNSLIDALFFSSG